MAVKRIHSVTKPTTRILRFEPLKGIKVKMENKKKLVLATALASLVGTVTINPQVSFAHEHAGHDSNDAAQCTEGASCSEAESATVSEDTKMMAPGKSGEAKSKKKTKKEKKPMAKCADGKCGSDM